MFRNIARVPRQKSQVSPLSFSGFAHGLNTASPAAQIRKTECSELVNWRIQRGGGLVTRPPITKYISTAITGSVKFFGNLPIDGTNYELIVGSDYKLYYKLAGVPTLIATLEGDAQLIAYNGVVVIMDGSYLKYLDDVASAKMLYDDGTGPTGYQFDNRAGGDDDGIALGNATNSRVAYKFTSQAWTDSYTIPPTTVTAVLQRVLDGYAVLDTEDIKVRLRKVSDDSILAEKTFIYAPIESNVSATATTYSADFASDDVTTEMSPGIDYYASIEYDNGNATNYISVRCYESEIGDELLSNPSFDSDTTGWIPGNDAVLSSEASGKIGNCLKILEDGTTNPYASQQVTCTAGDYYRFSGYVKDDSSEDVYAFRLWDRTHAGFITSLENATALTDWTTLYSGVFQMPVGCETVSVILRSGSLAAEGKHILFDEISFKKIETTGTAYIYTSSWAISALYKPLISLRPGRPPKGSFGAVADRRLFIAGDDDNPGLIWFSNLTHKDWSTAAGGGSVGAVDDNKNTYEIAALVSQYGDLYAFGTKDQRYLCKLTGTSPTTYAMPSMFQRVSTLNKTALSIGNDVVFASDDGVDALSGVQEYGDLRTYGISDPVVDRIEDYWSSSTIAGYYPHHGQYWLSMPEYHRILVFHMSCPATNPDGFGTRYPASEYEICLDDLTSSTYKWVEAKTSVYSVEAAAGGDPSISVTPDAMTLDGDRITKAASYAAMNDHEWWYGDNDSVGYDRVYFRDTTGDPDTTDVVLRSIMIPTWMGGVGNGFYVGASDGFVYQIDDDGYRDMDSHQLLPVLGFNYITFPFGYVEIGDVQVVASARGGAQLTTYFYIDAAKADYHTSLTFSLPGDDNLTVDDMTMTVAEATMTVGHVGGLLDPRDVPLFKHVNFNARSVKVLIRDIAIAGHVLYFNGMMLTYRRLEA